MSKLNCEVVRDLLPLCQDGVASKESTALVEEHLKDCPACREELEKLSAPVAVPPEEDGKEQEIRERLEQKARRRKRRNQILIGLGLVLLAILAVTDLWYTRPRSFAQIAGDWDATHLFAVLQAPDEVGDPFKEWRLSLDQDGNSDAVIDEFRTILEQEYHAPLRSYGYNVLFQGRMGFWTEIPKGSLDIDLTRSDGTQVHIAIYGNNENIIRIYESGQFGGTARWAWYDGPDGSFDALAQLVRVHGECTE